MLFDFIPVCQVHLLNLLHIRTYPCVPAGLDQLNLHLQLTSHSTSWSSTVVDELMHGTKLETC